MSGTICGYAAQCPVVLLSRERYDGLLHEIVEARVAAKRSRLDEP